MYMLRRVTQPQPTLNHKVFVGGELVDTLDANSLELRSGDRL